MITSKILNRYKNIRHGFFNKTGGVSKGIYKSLNCGPGSLDKKKNIYKNINIVSKKLGFQKNKLNCQHFLLYISHPNSFRTHTQFEIHNVLSICKKVF